MNYDVIIVGGGAAGLMCQHQLSDKHLKVLVIDKNSILGKKLLLTGNGRCNVTNRYSPQEFIERIGGEQKKFFYKAIHSFSTEDVVNFFKTRGVPLKLENDFQYFPVSNKAKDIVDVLTKTNEETIIHYEEVVQDIKPHQTQFQVVTNKKRYLTKHVVIASGSSSFPKTGSTGDGLIFAKELKIETVPFYPAETKVYAKMIEKLSLQGLQIPNASVSLLQTKHRQKGDLLFTHNGLSGPVIYHLSEEIYHSLAHNHKAVLSINLINITKDKFIHLLYESPAKTIESIVSKLTSKRLASNLFSSFQLPKKPIQDLKHETFNQIYEFLTNFHVDIDKVEDKTLAYVNGGGVKTKELHPSTMESKKYPGLYFIGETVDLHGPIGGYNITIAFSTAYLAANHIKENYDA
uniref:Flavoprotein n=1 Tax=Firmicutes bacterium enrichment culture clone fosmid MGS-M2 TaxID=1549349 RepID=A0A0B5KUB8_9FIRM|nr:hypothetical protein [Firmicutes bacterium enrichment culture clone fosmid MGS-M2]